MTGGYRVVVRDHAFVHLAVTNVALIAVGWGAFTWLLRPYARNDLGIGPALAPALGAQVLSRSPTAAFSVAAAIAAGAACSALRLQRRLPAHAVLTPRPE